MATLLQSRSSNPGSGGSIGLAYSGATTVGSTLIAVPYWNNATSTCTVADPTNGSWTALGGPQTGTGGLAAFRAQMFLLTPNAASTAITVTATLNTGTVLVGFAIHEYSGANVLEGSAAYNNGASALTGTTTSLTPLLSTDFAFSFAIFEANNTGVTYTQRESANFGNNATADKLSVTGGSATSCVYSGNIAGVFLMGHAIFTPSAAAVPGLQPFNPVPFMSNTRI